MQDGQIMTVPLCENLRKISCNGKCPLERPWDRTGLSRGHLHREISKEEIMLATAEEGIPGTHRYIDGN